MDAIEFEQLGLQKITAYIPSESSQEKKRNGSAERMRRMRDRKKATGIVTVELSAQQAATLEGDLALAGRVRQLTGLRKMIVMHLLT